MSQNVMIKDQMSKKPISINEEVKIGDALEFMRTLGIRHLPVIDSDEKIVGIVSENDLNRFIPIRGADCQAKEIMMTNPYVVFQNERLDKIIYNMIESKISSVIIRNLDGRILGIFTSIDALKLLYELISDPEVIKKDIYDFIGDRPEFQLLA